MQPIRFLEESALFHRITDSALKALVQQAATGASDLRGTVVIVMPLFTLHSERHILNVIGWMESLLGRDGIAQLGQLESALCILVAYTHDLGMTLDDRERAELPTDPGYLRHRDRFLVERHLIDRLRAEGDHGRANIIENHLRTDYLHVTHADGPATRMRNRATADRSEAGIQQRTCQTPVRFTPQFRF